jgi:hypothetical protein
MQRLQGVEAPLTNLRWPPVLDDQLESVPTLGFHLEIVDDGSLRSTPVPCLVDGVVTSRVEEGTCLGCTVDADEIYTGSYEAVSEIVLRPGVSRRQRGSP